MKVVKSSEAHSWRGVVVLAGREVVRTLRSPLGWGMSVVFLLAHGVVFALVLGDLNRIQGGPPGPPLELFFGRNLLFWMVVLAVVPILGQRSLAQERALGSLEGLRAAAISDSTLVVGKGLGMGWIYLLLWLPTLLYPLLLAWLHGDLGGIAVGPVIAGYLAIFTQGAAFLAAALWVSSWTRSPALAAVLTFGGLFFLVAAGVAAYALVPGGGEDLLSRSLAALDVGGRMGEMGRGLVDLRWLALDLGLAAAFSWLAIFSLRAQRRGPRGGGETGDGPSGFFLAARARGVVQPLGVALAAAVVALGPFLLLSLAGDRGWVEPRILRWDLSAGKVHSLTEPGREWLGTVESDVEILAAGLPSDPWYWPLEEILARMEAYSPHLETRMVDRQRNPLEVEDLPPEVALRLIGGGKQRAIPAEALVRWQEARRQAAPSETAPSQAVPSETAPSQAVPSQEGPSREGREQDGLPQRLVALPLEEVLRGEIEALLRPTNALAVTVGHGELSATAGARGLAPLLRALEGDGFRAIDWTLAPAASSSGGAAGVGARAGEAVPPPADAAVAVVAGPRQALGAPAQRALSGLLDSGGGVLLLLDARLPADPGSGDGSLGLGRWLAERGIDLGADLVVDPRRALRQLSDDTFSAPGWGDHPAAAGTGEPAVLSGARSVALTAAATSAQSGEGEESSTVLLSAGPDAWGESDLAALPRVGLDADDRSAPVPLAVARQLPSGGRLVVVGDSDFASGALIALGGNGDFLLSALRWLAHRPPPSFGASPSPEAAAEAAVAPVAARPEHLRLALSSSQLRRWQGAVILLPPLFVSLLAGMVFIQRRRR
ncbi:MAG: Gldg family protein [Acidobacteriota bacterium]